MLGIIDKTTIHNLLPFGFWNNIVDLASTSLHNAEFKCFWNKYKIAYHYISVVTDACKPWDRYKNQSNFCVHLGNPFRCSAVKANSAILIRLVHILSSSCGGRNRAASTASLKHGGMKCISLCLVNVKNTLRKRMANTHDNNTAH